MKNFCWHKMKENKYEMGLHAEHLKLIRITVDSKNRRMNCKDCNLKQQQWDEEEDEDDKEHTHISTKSSDCVKVVLFLLK